MNQKLDFPYILHIELNNKFADLRFSTLSPVSMGIFGMWVLADFEQKVRLWNSLEQKGNARF